MRFRLSILGVLGGAALGGGIVGLLQQASVAYPTPTLLAGAVAAGAAAGIVLPTLARPRRGPDDGHDSGPADATPAGAGPTASTPPAAAAPTTSATTSPAASGRTGGDPWDRASGGEWAPDDLAALRADDPVVAVPGDASPVDGDTHTGADLTAGVGDPSPVEPDAAGPVAAEPVPVEPVPAEPVPVDPTPVDAATVGSAPVEAARDEPASAAAPAETPPATVAFRPTHVVPAPGMAAWTAPDPTVAPVAQLEARVELVVVEEAGAWARVVGSNGWTGWVDGRLLVPVPQR